ncbi:DUF4911 domain-containing protein [Geobacter sp. FeAm09]|nr:DUF4911 domain-containing protein [Geobacter sp. FeAm09]
MPALHGRASGPGGPGGHPGGRGPVMACQAPPPVPLSDAVCRYFRVKHRDMVYLKFILEAYEGTNTMSTVDNVAGIIRIAVMPGFVAEMDDLLAELGRRVTMTPVSWEQEGE